MECIVNLYWETSERNTLYSVGHAGYLSGLETPGQQYTMYGYDIPQCRSLLFVVQQIRFAHDLQIITVDMVEFISWKERITYFGAEYIEPLEYYANKKRG